MLHNKEARADLYERTNTTHKDLSRLVKEARTRPRNELVKLIEEKQEEIVLQHCGPKYSRRNQYTRGSRYTKKLVTPLETIWFKVRRIIHR